MKKLLVLALLFPLGSAAQIQKLSCSSASITGAASDACTVTLSSPAGADGLTVSLISNNAAVTLPSNVWAASKATNVSFTVAVTAVTKAQTAIITSFYNHAGVKSPQTFSLNLYPVPVGGSSLSVTPPSLSFGNVTLNTTSTLSVTLKNAGNSAITGTAGVIGAGFSMSSLQVRLSPGQSSIVSTQFDPSSVGAFAGSLNIQTNAENSSVIIPLTGTGTAKGQHSITLDWVAPSSSAEPIAGYIAYRSTNGGAFAALNSTRSPATSYTDAAVQSGAKYSYYVESVGSSGSVSAPSGTVQASIP